MLNLHAATAQEPVRVGIQLNKEGTSVIVTPERHGCKTHAWPCACSGISRWLVLMRPQGNIGTFQLLHRDHISATSKNGRAVDTKDHTHMIGAALGAATYEDRIVPCDERDKSETNPP